jgi:hypothetical protein
MKTIIFALVTMFISANVQAVYQTQPLDIEEKSPTVFDDAHPEATHGWWLDYHIGAYCQPIDQAKNTEGSCGGIFGIYTKNQEGEEEFEITDAVPLVEGQVFGWAIWVSPKITKVKLKEVFELSAKPEAWGSGEAGEKREIAEDGKVSITESEVVVEDGYIHNVWSVEAGDPVGDCVIQVFVNDRLLETFHFKIVPGHQ